MKDRLRIWPMKALAALALACGVFPIPMLLGKWLYPENALLWYLPFTLAYLWGVGGYLLPKKACLPWTVAGCVLSVGLIWFFLAARDLRSLLLALPCAALLILLPPAWARPTWEEWSPGWWIAGAGLHLAGQMFAARTMFSDIQAPLMGFFLAYAFLMLMYLNRTGIRDGMHGAEKAPASLRRRNTALVAVVFLIAAAASAWGTLAKGLEIAWYYIRLGIAYVVSFLMRLLPAAEPGSGGQGMGGMDFGDFAEVAESNAFALFMEKVFQVLAALLIAALIFLALRIIVRNVRRLWKRMIARLRLYAAATNEDYVDEAESTLNWDEKTQSIRDRVKEAIHQSRKQPRWEELDGRARVRRLYRQYIQRKPEARGRTVREALGQDKRLSPTVAGAFADLYERARYSDHDVSSQDADRMRKEL